MTFSKLGKDTDTGKLVYLPRSARTQGLYVLGMQRMGKSGLFSNLIIEDIRQGIGVCVLDPHGELVDDVIARIPANREKDVLFLDLLDTAYPFGINILECPDPTSDDKITETVNQVTHVFEKAFGVSQAATPRIYDYLFNSAYTLIANPGHTLIDIRLLFNASYRQKLLANVHSEDVLNFWDDVKQLSQQEQSKEARDILRRLNDLSHAPLRNIVGQNMTTINLLDIMDKGKILLVKLDRKLEQATSLIGSILVALILNASDARTTTRLFNLYADEFQNFATEDFAVLLEQAGKRNIGISMAHQNRSQLELSEKQADANLKTRTLSVGSLVAFRIPTDAEEIAGQFDTTPPPSTETRSEPIRAISHNPVEDLIQHGHADDFVRNFVLHYLKTLVNDINALRRDDMVDICVIPQPGENIYKDQATYYSARYQLEDGLKEINEYYTGLMEKTIQPYSKEESNCMYRIIYSLRSWLNFAPAYNYDSIHPGMCYPIDLDEQTKIAIASLLVTLDSLQKKSEDYTNEDKLRLNLTNHTIFSVRYGAASRQVLEQVRKTKTEEELKALLSDRAQYEHKCLMIITRQLMRGGHILAQQPIMVSTGQYDEKPVGQLSSAEMKARITTELVHLERFTAWVKIGELLPDNPGKKCLKCGRLNTAGTRYCTHCKTRLPAPNEYVITTIDPKEFDDLEKNPERKPLSGRALQGRVSTIQKNNRDKKYVRERKEVEAEITQRQIGFSGGSSPAQQKQLPRRVARTVPVQENCSNCGAANQPGSKFCNQCGEKL